MEASCGESRNNATNLKLLTRRFKLNFPAIHNLEQITHLKPRAGFEATPLPTLNQLSQGHVPVRRFPDQAPGTSFWPDANTTQAHSQFSTMKSKIQVLETPMSVRMRSAAQAREIGRLGGGWSRHLDQALVETLGRCGRQQGVLERRALLLPLAHRAARQPPLVHEQRHLQALGLASLGVGTQKNTHTHSYT